MYVIIPISSTGSDSVIHTIRLSLSSIVASHMTHPLLSPLKFRTPLYPFIVVKLIPLVLSDNVSFFLVQLI